MKKHILELVYVCRLSVDDDFRSGYVFERFTLMARRVVLAGRFEATECRSAIFDADHLLLGLLRENPAIAGRLLQPGEDAATIRSKIQQRQSVSKPTQASDDMPLSKAALRVLKLAVREAKFAKRSHVGTGDVLLGLLSVEGTVANELLRERELELVALRAELAQTNPAENEGTD